MIYSVGKMKFSQLNHGWKGIKLKPKKTEGKVSFEVN